MKKDFVIRLRTQNSIRYYRKLNSSIDYTLKINDLLILRNHAIFFKVSLNCVKGKIDLRHPVRRDFLTSSSFPFAGASLARE